MSANGRPRYSVVILTANRRASLERCLRSIAAQRFPEENLDAQVPQFEVVVVDNGSTDGTREWLMEQEIIERLTVAEGDQTGSFAEARNLGVDAAAGECICFLDDDCEADPGWLAAIDENFSAGFDAIGGKTQPPAWMAFPWWWDRRMNWAVGLQGPDHENPDTAGSLAYPDTSNMAVRREVLRQEPFQTVGGTLDGSENIYQWGREDAELWRRLRLKGHRTCFNPQQIVTHHIDPNRLRWWYIMPRAWRDGASFWNREKCEAYHPFAYGDQMALPENLVRSFFQRPSRWIPTMLAHILWASRQNSFCFAAWREIGTWKTVQYKFGALKRYLVGLTKRILRRPIWLGCRLIRLSLWKSVPSKPRHIVVACQGFMGDSVLLAPMLSALRKRNPEARITFVTNRFGRELQGQHPAVDHVIEISPIKFLHHWERIKEVRRVMRGLRADLVYVPYWHHTSAWPLVVSHSAPVIGFDHDMGFSRQLWTDLLDRRVGKDETKHEIENLLALVGEWPTSEHSYDLAPLDEPTEWLEETLAKTDEGFIAIHMDATGEGKAWPEEKWISLIQELQRTHPNRRVALGGHAGLRPRMDHLIEEHLPGVINACASRPMGDFAALLRHASLLVTTCSGPKHLAMAVGTPTVTLYGHSSWIRWGAWCDQEKHRSVISPGWDLRPEELIPRGPDHKMALISVEAVTRAVNDALRS